MQSLVSLETVECYDPELQSYLKEHRWPATLEALVTGLAVMMPRDPWEFVAERLHYLKDEHITDIHWDMFVDPTMRPRLPLLRKGMLDSLLDDADQPTEEMFEKAFHFRKTNLFRWCFDAWLDFHEMEKRENAVFLQRLALSKLHYRTTTRKKILRRWRIARKKSRVQTGCAILWKLRSAYLKRTTFAAWLEDYRTVRREKKWFERQGQGGDGEEGGGENTWCWPEGEDPISSLPKEVTIKIFGYVGIHNLCRCARVCRSWKDITEDPQLWNMVDVFPARNYVTDSVILRLFHKYRPLLGHLNLRGCTQLTADSLRFIGQCQNLQDLNLSDCKGLSDEVLDTIAKGCSGLLYLNLSYSYVTDSIIRILTKRCMSLHYLSLAYCRQFTSKGLHSIVGGKGCRRLVYLDLTGCTQLTADGMHSIGRGCPILNTLLLDDITNITDNMILTFAAHCHTLRHISIMGGSRLSDRALKHLFSENRKLRSIKIENNAVMTDSTIRTLVKACRDLQHVYVAGCVRVTDQGLRALGSLKKLQVLNIADCTRVSDAGVRSIIENASGAQLRELNLTNCIKISDVSPLRISQHCRSLTYLSFCYCDHISDAGVELLGHIPSLTSLDLSGCSITNQGVAVLGNNPQFRNLSLTELADVTDDGLQKMCSTLSKLETLDLSDCENITNLGLQTIAYHCRLLRGLYIANCYQVTDDGTKYLSQGCAYIAHLDMSGCSITDKTLKLLRRGCTNLVKLDIVCCVNVTSEAVQKYQNKGVEINYNTDRPKHMPADLSVKPLFDRL